ncbi:MAG: Class II aldolase/adducin family protein [Candidatus Peregrinibacteria bacterium GW2011_GWF2_43_17]|nr:MAG: Class II aldolase/adducin family protein [Candidatus Peregrinibacteria bacterium GW2011_GWF2_43_17]
MNTDQLKKLREVATFIQSEISSFGNISFRDGDKFQITKTGAVLNDLTEGDFVPPLKKNNPSSETKLHAFIYKKRPEINWIIHLHDDFVLKNAKKLNLPTTKKEQPFGTQALVDEVGQILGLHNYIIMKNHGIIALGSSLDDTIDLIIKIHGQND